MRWAFQANRSKWWSKISHHLCIVWIFQVALRGVDTVKIPNGSIRQQQKWLSSSITQAITFTRNHRMWLIASLEFTLGLRMQNEMETIVRQLDRQFRRGGHLTSRALDKESSPATSQSEIRREKNLFGRNEEKTVTPGEIRKIVKLSFQRVVHLL